MLSRLAPVALALLAACERTAAPDPGASASASLRLAPARTSPGSDEPGARGPSTGGVSQLPKLEHEREVVTAGCKPGETCVKYRELVLGGGDGSKPLPLVVALHGLGDRPETFSKLFEAMPFQARVVLPRGFDAFRGGFRWMSHKPGAADDLLATETRDAADRLAAATEALAKSLPTKGRPVVTGFSQGGILSFYLATHHPKVFATAVPIAGMLLPAQFPTAPCKPGEELPPIVAVHGTADAVIPLESAEAAVKAIAALGCEATLVRVEGAHHDAPPPMMAAIEKALGAAVFEAAGR